MIDQTFVVTSGRDIGIIGIFVETKVVSIMVLASFGGSTVACIFETARCTYSGA